MSVFIDEDGNAISRSFVQPTASVDAEQVWREALTAFANAGNQAATAVIQAYGDARADAARREGEQTGLNRAEQACNRVFGLTIRQRMSGVIRALKENPNEG